MVNIVLVRRLIISIGPIHCQYLIIIASPFPLLASFFLLLLDRLLYNSKLWHLCSSTSTSSTRILYRSLPPFLSSQPRRSWYLSLFYKLLVHSPLQVSHSLLQTRRSTLSDPDQLSQRGSNAEALKTPQQTVLLAPITAIHRQHSLPFNSRLTLGKLKETKAPF